MWAAGMSEPTYILFRGVVAFTVFAPAAFLGWAYLAGTLAGIALVAATGFGSRQS